MPIDFGTHHLWNSSGFDQASNTRRGRAVERRVTTSSRSDLRSTVVRFVAAASLSFLRPSSFSFRFSSSTTLSSSSNRASQSWWYVSIHAATSSSRRGRSGSCAPGRPSP